MMKRKTTHSGKRKRKARRPLPPGKKGAVWVRSMPQIPPFQTTTRNGVQYVRRANRRARASGFHTAESMAAHLIRLYEYAKRMRGMR